MKHLKKILAIALIALSVMAVALPALAASEWATVFGGELRLRKEANASSTILDRIPSGTRIYVTYNSIHDAWFKTSYKNANDGITRTGYVDAGYVNLDSSWGR